VSRLPSIGPRGEGWVAIQAVLLVLAGLAGLPGPAWHGALRFVTSAAGTGLVAVGLAFAVLGIRELRQAMTPLPYPREDAALVQSGVYSLVRHPVYTGLVLGAFGWGLVSASPAALAAAVILLAFFELKSRREEAWLAERFPDYAAYRSRTPRLFPQVSRGRGGSPG